jgi:catechol 2,3-dioxygenase-like lactoylglutathione lyase family enzyme
MLPTSKERVKKEVIVDIERKDRDAGRRAQLLAETGAPEAVKVRKDREAGRRAQLLAQAGAAEAVKTPRGRDAERRAQLLAAARGSLHDVDIVDAGNVSMSRARPNIGQEGSPALTGPYQGDAMSPLSLGPVHHIRLTVNDVERSKAFYTEVLGFEVAMDTLPPEDDEFYGILAANLQGGVVLMNAGTFIGLRPTDPDRQSAKDLFDPFRVGLDHLSFNVASRAELESAISRLDEWGVPHSNVTELVPFGIALLPFKDPDGIQLEICSPL